MTASHIDLKSVVVSVWVHVRTKLSGRVKTAQKVSLVMKKSPILTIFVRV